MARQRTAGVLAVFDILAFTEVSTYNRCLIERSVLRYSADMANFNLVSYFVQSWLKKKWVKLKMLFVHLVHLYGLSRSYQF